MRRAALAGAVAAAVCAAGCPAGGGGRRDEQPRPPLAPIAVPEAEPFVWNQMASEVGCAASACEPYRLAIEFDREEEVTGAGWRRAAATKNPALFAGGVWTAPAGEHDEWLQGPDAWGRLVDRAHGWAVTATVAVRAQAAACTASTPGPGLRLAGDLGAMTVTLLPDGPQSAPGTARAGAPYTIRLEGGEHGVRVLVDGKEVSGGGLSLQGWSSSPAIELGQLGCSHFESRWDRLVVEANIAPCADCAPDEHALIAAVRRRVPGGAVASGTGGASGACLAHAALDHAIRTLLVAALANAGQADRAGALARLDPLTDHSSIEIAALALGEMGAPIAPQGCDPVRSADECDGPSPPEPEPVPPLVAVARQQFPNTGWVDWTASGRERIVAAALAIHEAAGAPALSDLLARLTALGRAGGACRPAQR